MQILQAYLLLWRLDIGTMLINVITAQAVTMLLWRLDIDTMLINVITVQAVTMLILTWAG